MKNKTTVKPYKLIIVVVVLFFFMAIIKLSYIVLSDTVDGVNLKEKSASITTVEKTLYASRGKIYDKNGEILSRTVNSYKLIAYLDPKRSEGEKKLQHVKDKKLTASLLSPILNMKEEEILKILSKEGKYQVEFGTKGKGLTDLDKNKIEKLELPGLDFIVSTKRYYNKGKFASYIIGYAKENDTGNIVGELGIEKYYNDILSGTDGYKKYQRYTSGFYQIPNTPAEIVEAKNGANIYLTIDTNIQLLTEKAMKSFSEYDMDWASITVMDAKTGAIVSSATTPSFNPNDLNTITNYLNPLVSYEYEPGSVMKVFSFASAIEENKYDGAKTYKSGSIEVADVVIRDATRAGWGTITFDKGFAYSSNVASTILALDLGVKDLTRYYNDLGFGKKTGIELANEIDGKIDFQYKSELSNASFGQGITVTPVQMLQGLSVITNSGTALKPYIVEKIVDDEENVLFQAKRTEVKKVYSDETIKKMQSLMYDVVYNGLTTMWQPKYVKVIAKTGTAQIASPKGGYLDGEYDYVKSFAGIFPADNPKYILYYSARKLKTSTTNMANIVTTLIDDIAQYSKFSESESDVNYSKILTVDNYISKNINDSVNELVKYGLQPVVIGDGKYIIDQFPIKNDRVLLNNKVFLKTNCNNYTMLDLSKWSMNEVKTYCDIVNISCIFNGYGTVVSQSMAKDSILDKTSVVTFELMDY